MGDSQRSVPPPSFNNSDLKVLGKINGKKASRKNVLGNIDESGLFPQPLPEASHDEAPSSGSLNVSMKSKGKNVDVSLCDESSSFSGPTKSRSYLISSILDEVKGKDIAKVEDVDLDDLMKDMSELLKLGEKDIRGPFKGLLTGTRSALPFVTPIDHCLERCDAVFTNRENCWHLIKEMYYLASFHKKLRENPKGMQDVMQEATALIFEGAPVCCAEIGRSAFRSFFSTLEIEGALKDFTERLNLMPIRITLQMGFRILSDIERQGRSHLSKGYPTPAVEVKDVNLDDLWEHISELWKLREKGNHEKARSLGPFTWPAVPGLQKLKEIVSFGTDLPIEKIYGAVQAILEEIGRENVATAAPLVVACALERLDDPYTHTEEFWHLVKEMYDLAIVLKRLSESPEGTQDVMQDATSLIVEGARVLSLQGGLRRSASEVRAIRQKLNTMKRDINTEFTGRVLTPIQHQRRSHLSKEYPTHAESGPFSQALPGAFHDEGPFSGSFNVSMESKGKNVDVSLNVSGISQRDEASSSGYFDLPKRSEGQDVDVNLNISGAPRCDEAPSSSSSSGPTKSRSDEIKYKVEDVNLDHLWKHISKLWKLREKGNHQEASILGHFPWPDVSGLRKLERIASVGADLRIKDICGLVKALLKEVGRANVATAAPLVVAHTLEKFDAIFTNREKCWHLIKEMYYLAIVLKRLRESAEGMQDVMQEATSFEGMQDVMHEATSLIIEGALVCFTQTGRSALTRFFSTSELKCIAPSNHHRNRRYRFAIHKILKESAEGMQHVVGGASVCCNQIGCPNSERFFFSTSPSEFERALGKIREKLNAMYMHINTEITLRVFTLIQHQRRSHLSKECPTHAESDPFSQLLPEASHDEAPFSGSLNVSMKWKGKIVDVSPCDEASSDLPKTSEDDVNLNISGVPRCDEAPSSSSSSSGPTKSISDLISSKCKDICKVEDFNLDDLMKDMSELLKLREKENHQKASSLGDLRRQGIHGFVKATLVEIGRVNSAGGGLLVIPYAVERFDAMFTNREKCWHLIKEMYGLAIVLKRLRESPEGMQDVMQDATSLIIECALKCCTQIGSSASTRYFTAVLMEKALEDIMERLNVMHIKISIQIRFRALTAIQRQERSHLSKGYATQAESGPFSQALPGACHDEAPFSESFNVSMESKGKNVDVNLNVSETPRCDEASSSGYSDLPKRSEGQDVDVNLNISGAPRCDEAPSSSSSSGPTKSRSDLSSSKLKDKVEDVNLDDLWKHISELRKLREKGNHQEASILDHFPWPDFPGLQKLKEIVSFGTDLRIKDIHGPVKALLKEIGRVNVATAAPLVVAHTLEKFDDIFTNREKCWHLIKEMYDLAIVLKRLRESAEGMQDVMQEATSLIIEGALVCFTQTGRSAFTRFFSTSPLEFEGALSNIRQKLNGMYIKINTEIALRGLTLIEHQGRSPLSKEYPTRADNGQVEEDLLSTGRQKVFKIEALVAATNNFHEDNKVGEGGFGAVYKGTTHDREQIAVKKMSLTSNEGRKQFMNEKLLPEVQHLNLLSLLGSCEQESQGFLVYQYLPNKSLDQFLFDPENRKRLDWYKRYNIIEGIVCGLCYLHEYSQRRIVHRDIKTSNILLDEKLNPKIADFGTAKLFPEDRTHVTATRAVGTFGYMPPEYVMTGNLSVRTDVYSFGIVLLELLTGEKISSDAFLERVWSSYNQNKVAHTIDRTITETWDKEKGKAKAKAKALALRCFQVALLCIQNEAKLRPTMSRVITMLSSCESLPVPTKPPLVSSPRRPCF